MHSSIATTNVLTIILLQSSVILDVELGLFGTLKLKSGDFYKTTQKMIWHHLAGFFEFCQKTKMRVQVTKFFEKLKKYPNI